MSTAKPPVPSYRLVGGCYDLIRFDPMDWAPQRALKVHIAFDLSELEDIPDAEFSKPRALFYQPAGGGKIDRVVWSQSSSYDLALLTKREGELSVSDPTGDLMACTVSDAFTNLSQTEASQNSVTTSVSETYGKFSLGVVETAELSADLADAFAQLPDDVAADNAAYKDFIQRFGTHYLKQALFGGKVVQRLSVNSQDYVSLLENDVNMAAQATMTLEVARSKASASAEDKRDQKFTQSSSLEVDHIRYVGGKPQQFIDMWVTYVDSNPLPIQSSFEPLYNLLTPDLNPGILSPGADGDVDFNSIAKRNALLKEAIASYMIANGKDVTPSILSFGDVVALEAQTPGPPRRLAAGDVAFCHTVVANGMNNAQLKPSTSWQIVDPGNPQNRERVAPNKAMGLKNLLTGKYLDACSGTEGNTYLPGDGLTGATADDAGAPTAQWTATLAGSPSGGDGWSRDCFVNGDIVCMQPGWMNRRGRKGFLLCESSADDDKQRVYAFGQSNQIGAFWKICRG